MLEGEKQVRRILKEDARHRESIVKKRFETAVREKFQPLNRTYDPEAVFQSWVRLVKEGPPAEHFLKNPWKSDTTIREALDSLEILFGKVVERVKNHK
jgi:hypothetical protein